MEIIKNLAAFIFVLGLLVMIHELGHFTVAKWNKMHVYQFCIGLGPKIFKYQGKETLYAICLLPIGGMVDLREDEDDVENKRSFAGKKPYQRLMVILAGAIMNFILAYVIIVTIFFSEALPTTVIGELSEDKPAIEAGLELGDKIITINDEDIKYWNDITTHIALSGDTTFQVQVERDGQVLDYTIEGYKDTDGYYKVGIGPEFSKSFTLAIKYGTYDFMDKSTLIFDAFIDLITRKVDASQVSGPVGIYKQVGEVAQTNDIRNLMYFTALLSINLGIFNLLPFPFLDGGRAIFILYEMIMRKPVNKEKEAFVHFVGMVLLLSLMVVLIFKDLRM